MSLKSFSCKPIQSEKYLRETKTRKPSFLHHLKRKTMFTIFLRENSHKNLKLMLEQKHTPTFKY